MIQYIPAIAITEQTVGETLLITAACGQHKVSRYVPGAQLTQAKADVIRAAKFHLVTELASHILKDTA